MASRYPTAIDAQSLQYSDFKLVDGLVAIETALTSGQTPMFTTPNSTGGQVTLNISAGAVQDLTLTANCTITLTGSSSGVACTMLLIIRQDGTGNRTITWPSGSTVVKWPSGAAPVLSTGANAVDIVTLSTVNNGSIWFGTLLGKGYS